MTKQLQPPGKLFLSVYNCGQCFALYRSGNRLLGLYRQISICILKDMQINLRPEFKKNNAKSNYKNLGLHRNNTNYSQKQKVTH